MFCVHNSYCCTIFTSHACTARPAGSIVILFVSVCLSVCASVYPTAHALNYLQYSFMYASSMLWNNQFAIISAGNLHLHTFIVYMVWWGS